MLRGFGFCNIDGDGGEEGAAIQFLKNMSAFAFEGVVYSVSGSTELMSSDAWVSTPSAACIVDGQSIAHSEPVASNSNSVADSADHSDDEGDRHFRQVRTK